ncbi:MAG: peptidylprolyl isomerase [Kiritimatiellaeota bacterium]|nr:peptidylprolyl isomerase [Kiritimatiellota bacterium]
MIRPIFVLVMAVGLLAGGGCQKKKLEPGVIIADKQVALADMAPTDVIVSVNGQALTRQAHDDKLDLHVALYELRTPQATRPAVNTYRSARAAKVIPEYVNKQLILQEGKRLGIRLTAEELAESERMIWRSLMPNKVDDNFAAVLGAKTALYKQNAAEDAYMKAIRKAVYADRLAVSDEEVGTVMKRRADWNENYAESNKVVVARGEEIVRELRAGADFAEMALKVSQHQPEDGKEWGEFTYSEIDDPKLRAEAFRLPVGAVSDPIDSGHGLLIIRVLERTEGAEEESAVAKQVASVKLAKILLLMYDPFPPMNHEQIRAAIEKERVEEIQKEWMPVLHKAARIEYPNGTNLWPKAASKARRQR